jgi:predicted Zn-dependent peptidase
MSAVELSVLANGLRVASLSMPVARSVAVALVADVGSRHETAQENGLAHLFEHMLFKGTAGRSARAIAEAIEDVGGQLNAWTSRDGTMFHARVLAADLPLAVELVADLVMAPRFDPADLALERQVVLSEIGEAADSPEDRVFDLAQALAFPDQPMGRPILGTAETLAGLDVPALSGWRDRHYAAPGLVLVAAGAVSHAQLLALAETHLAGLPGHAPPVALPACFAGGVAGEKRRTEQSHMVLAFAGPGLHAPDHHAAQLFATALGGGMSSRLFQELREDRGLAYSVSAHHQPHADTGMATIYLATAPADAPRAAALALEVARDLATTLSPAELDRARAQLKAGLLMGLESCVGQVDWLGRTLLAFGRAIPVSEVESMIDAVTVEAARAAGAAMLAGAPVLASIGPRPLGRLP